MFLVFSFVFTLPLSSLSSAYACSARNFCTTSNSLDQHPLHVKQYTCSACSLNVCSVLVFVCSVYAVSVLSLFSACRLLLRFPIYLCSSFTPGLLSLRASSALLLPTFVCLKTSVLHHSTYALSLLCVSCPYALRLLRFCSALCSSYDALLCRRLLRGRGNRTHICNLSLNYDTKVT